MNFLKRSFVSIFRKPGKSLILLLLVFLLCNIIAGAVSVKDALDLTKRSLLEKMGAEVRVVVDYNWIYDSDAFDWSQLKNIDSSLVDELSKSPYVKRADYVITTYLQGEGLERVKAPDPPLISDIIIDDPGIVSTPSFTVIGCSQPILKDVEANAIRLTDGRVYTREEISEGKNVVLISSDLATLNGLKVGDSVTLMTKLTKWDMETYEITEIPVRQKFEIIGLFSEVPTGEEDYHPDYKNNIYAPSSAITGFIDECHRIGEENGFAEEEMMLNEQVNASFIIDSIDNIAVFEAENKGKLPLGYTFEDNFERLAGVAKPMDNIKLIANIILYVAVGATVLIIGLLVTLFLKDRIREMGIYLSLGEKKVKIATQIVVEVMAVALVAVSLSLFSGNVLARQLSSGLLEDQLGSDESNDTYHTDADVTGDDVIEEYNISLTANTVGFIYLIGLGSVLVSTLIPIACTLRLKPRKILM